MPPPDAFLPRAPLENPLQTVVCVTIFLRLLRLLEHRTGSHPIPEHDRVALARTTSQALADLLLRLDKDLAVPGEPGRRREIVEEPKDPRMVRNLKTSSNSG
jgi:hypothetical protein